MTTQIGIISDPHATPGPLEEALLLLRQQGVEDIYCLGDIAGYGTDLEQTVELLREYDCGCILGNHDQWFLEEHPEHRADTRR